MEPKIYVIIIFALLFVATQFLAKYISYKVKEEKGLYLKIMINIQTILIMVYALVYAHTVTGYYISNILIGILFAALQRQGFVEHTGIFYALAIYYQTIDLLFLALATTYSLTMLNEQKKISKWSSKDSRALISLIIFLILLFTLA